MEPGGGHLRVRQVADWACILSKSLLRRTRRCRARERAEELLKQRVIPVGWRRLRVSALPDKLTFWLAFKHPGRFDVMTTQIITLIGVFIGAAVSYFATTATERARHKRAMETRWDERKLNIYADYGSAVKQVNRAARDALAARGEPRKLTALITKMDEAEAHRSILFETLMLLADPTAVEVANAVNQKLWQLLDIVRSPVTADDIDRERLAIELMSALTELHERARLDLGITGQLRRTSMRPQ